MSQEASAMELMPENTDRVEHPRPVGATGDAANVEFELEDPTVVAFGIVALVWIGLLMACLVF
jgi:hypothetical protein